jgi:hypothetical protein
MVLSPDERCYAVVGENEFDDRQLLLSGANCPVVFDVFSKSSVCEETPFTSDD